MTTAGAALCLKTTVQSASARRCLTARFVHSAQQADSSTATAVVDEGIQSHGLNLNFDNHKEAFRSKTNSQLLRGLFVLKLLTVDKLVAHNHALLNAARKALGPLFPAVMRATIYGHFVAGDTRDEVKPRVSHMRQYGVKSILDYSVERDVHTEDALADAEVEAFESKPDTPVSKTLQTQNQLIALAAQEQAQFTPYKELWDRRVGVTAARTYFYSSEPECDENANIFMDSVDAVAETTEGTGFCAIKITALGRPSFLIRLSEVIARSQQFFRALTGSSWEEVVQAQLSREQLELKLKELAVKTDKAHIQEWFDEMDFDHNGLIDLWEWDRLLDNSLSLGRMFKILNIRTGELEPLVTDFSPKDQQQFENMINRLVRLVEHAQNKGVRLMIDAEQTYFQPAINRLTLEMMRKYNGDVPVVFNTYQAYLRSAATSVQIDMHLARRENFHFGCKLVRGAYIEQERKRAADIGYPDPINPTFEATSAMYERIFKAVLDECVTRDIGKVSVMCATHNEESVRMAVREMAKRAIGPQDKVVCFGQLYGMCDQVSFSLGQAGYSVYKYVPYGPVDKVLPYLSRRAHENSGMIKKAQKERQMLWAELKRRWSRGQLFYRPQPDARVPA